MLVFSYSEARKKLAEVLDLARKEEVIIRRRNGEIFSVTGVRRSASPLDVSGITTGLTGSDLVAAIRKGRER